MLMTRKQMAGSLQAARPPLRGNAILAGVQAAVAVALAVGMVAVSPWSSMIGAASLGAMAALFGRFAPQRRRSVIVVYAALCMTFPIGIPGQSISTRKAVRMMISTVPVWRTKLFNPSK